MPTRTKMSAAKKSARAEARLKAEEDDLLKQMRGVQSNAYLTALSMRLGDAPSAEHVRALCEAMRQVKRRIEYIVSHRPDIDVKRDVVNFLKLSTVIPSCVMNPRSGRADTGPDIAGILRDIVLIGVDVFALLAKANRVNEQMLLAVRDLGDAALPLASVILSNTGAIQDDAIAYWVAACGRAGMGRRLETACVARLLRSVRAGDCTLLVAVMRMQGCTAVSGRDNVALSMRLFAEGACHMLQTAAGPHPSAPDVMRRVPFLASTTLGEAALQGVRTKWVDGLERMAAKLGGVLVESVRAVRRVKRSRVCYMCHGRQPGTRLQTCEQCRSFYYCSEACQRKHWVSGSHRFACKMLSVAVKG